MLACLAKLQLSHSRSTEPLGTRGKLSARLPPLFARALNRLEGDVRGLIRAKPISPRKLRTNSI